MSRTPEQILDHHNNAVFTNDLEAMKYDYADDAILISLSGVCRGPDEIGEALRTLVLQMPNMRPFENPNAGVTIEGDTMLLRWALDSDAGTIEDAFDTIIFKDGKIWRQTTSYEIRPK